MAALDRAEPLANPARAYEGGYLIRTLRLAVVGMVALLVLVGTSMAVAAPDDEATLDPMRSSMFTLRTSEVVSIDALEWSVGHGYGEALGREFVFLVEATDPRLSGTLRQVYDIRAFPIDEAEDIHATVWSGAMRIDNEDGGRVGTVDGYHDGAFGQEWNRLIGEGAYAGLMAVFRYNEETDTSDGVIIPGAPPAYPDPVPATEPPTE